MALTANKVLVSDNNGDISASTTDSSKLAYIGSLTSNAEQTGNKVTSLSSANTDTQYPSAKAVYDEIVPNVTASYTAVSNKGGTLPATQNLANLATAINSIPSGGGGSSKYGCTIDNLLGDIDANGVLELPTVTSNGLDFSGVVDIGHYGLYYKFSHTKLGCSVSFLDLETISGNYGLAFAFEESTVTSISLPKLKTVTGIYGMQNILRLNTSITSLSLPELTTISSVYGCGQMCNGCINLTYISLPKLTTITGNYGLYYLLQGTKIQSFSLPELTTALGIYCLGYCCQNCQLLETASFPKLSDISGTYTLAYGFNNCRNITDIYFNSLTTSSFGSNVNQFTGMFNSLTAYESGTCTVHFPSNLSSTISGLTGYPLFGGTSGVIVLAFDLPATS